MVAVALLCSSVTFLCSLYFPSAFPSSLALPYSPGSSSCATQPVATALWGLLRPAGTPGTLNTVLDMSWGAPGVLQQKSFWRKICAAIMGLLSIPLAHMWPVPCIPAAAEDDAGTQNRMPYSPTQGRQHLWAELLQSSQIFALQQLFLCTFPFLSVCGCYRVAEEPGGTLSAKYRDQEPVKALMASVSFKVAVPRFFQLWQGDLTACGGLLWRGSV